MININHINKEQFTRMAYIKILMYKFVFNRRCCLSMFGTNCYAAFTLSEVLITLGIIGIVAALTIPTLISNMQEMYFHAKWKECYAILNNAFKMTVAENPGMNVKDVENYYLKREFVDAMLSHLQVVDTCGGREGYAENMCDNYEHYENNDYWKKRIKYRWSVLGRKYKTLAGGEVHSGYDFGNKAALLKNGAAIYFGGLHSGHTIVVDVNNYNGGPNVLGKDVYAISICSEGLQYYKEQFIESLSFRPYGAKGSRCVDEDAICTYPEPSEGYGVRGCSKDIGSADATYLIEASGAGCGYKYLK